jgi:hypothetical protein
MDTKVLAITGMHRSGTSLAAQYLGECGLSIGSKLLNSDLTNPSNSCAGHHEDIEFLSFHKQVLQKNGRDVSALLADRLSLPFKIDNQDKKVALELVESRVELPQWGWKDPRTTLFLDFWSEMVSDIGYLFLLRHPLSVVDSLVRRGNEKTISRKPINGLRIWNIYNQEVLKFWKVNSANSIVCEIDELIRNSTKVSQFLAEKLGIILKDVAIDDVFSTKAFHTDYSDAVEKMKSQYSIETSESISLYHELRDIAKSGL